MKGYSLIYGEKGEFLKNRWAASAAVKVMKNSQKKLYTKQQQKKGGDGTGFYEFCWRPFFPLYLIFSETAHVTKEKEKN